MITFLSVALAILGNAGFGWWLLNQTFDDEAFEAVGKLHARGWPGQLFLFIVASGWFLIVLAAVVLMVYRRMK